MTVNPPRRILHLEDRPEDAELIRAALEAEGITGEVAVVATVGAFREALARGDVDLILSDFALPSFDGLSALHLARELAPDVPFIFVSGSMGEEAAIETLHRGATDYVIKDRLSRLVPAVRRALQEAAERRERRAVEEALRVSQQRFAIFMNNSPAVAFMKDQAGRYVYVNEPFARLRGMPAAAIEGKTDYDLLPPELADRLRENDRTALAGGRMLQVHETLPAHDGAMREWLMLEFPMRDPSGALYLGGMAIDITEQRQAEQALQKTEEQFRQAQKMEAVGRLAGGVAHDFNNLLTAILGYGQLMRRKLRPEDAGLRDIDEILKAAERAASLTRQLLAFSRQQVLEPKVLDLNAVVTDMHKMLRRLIGEDIDLVTAPAADLGRVKADPGQIEQVLLNLVVNARDAMPDGGKLTIETANVELDETYASARSELRPGRYVMLAVSDTGIGMPPEVKARSFEPFFTTKEKGKGTGLGLSTVHGIVKQSDGHIEVYSEPAQGTTFKIYLPRVEEAAEQMRSPRVPPPRLEGAETILLVEDEDLIRRVLRESLELHGYGVLEARDGSEAIALCERRTQPIHLLVSDVVMPLMNGPELMQRVARVRPELRVLFISGYTDRALVHQGLRGQGTAFLQKPFTPDTLARKVRELLDEPPQAAA